MNANLLVETLARKAWRDRLPKAVILVHLYGQSADIDPHSRDLQPLRRFPHRGRCRGPGRDLQRPVAGRLWPGGHLFLQRLVSSSNHKIITTSGGGMLVSDDADLIAHARKLATQARDHVPHDQHSEIGYNYRLSNILAGVGRGQLRVLGQRVAAKQRILALSLPKGLTTIGRRWASPRHRLPSAREDVRLALESQNIESRHVWKPKHLQPIFSPMRCRRWRRGRRAISRRPLSPLRLGYDGGRLGAGGESNTDKRRLRTRIRGGAQTKP